MKHISVIAAMLMVMGTALMPGCDEGKGNNPIDLLVMKYAANSKYYLRFDVDYDNDTVVDEHVEMRVTRHFNYIGSGLERYQAEFVGKNCLVWMDLPRETNGPTEYDKDDIPEFNFTCNLFIPDNNYYSNETDHDFTILITEWGGSTNTIRANFSGYISDEFDIPPSVIKITNGDLYARISDYYGD